MGGLQPQEMDRPLAEYPLGDQPGDGGLATAGRPLISNVVRGMCAVHRAGSPDVVRNGGTSPHYCRIRQARHSSLYAQAARISTGGSLGPPR
jgi:hypothetical protein